MLYRLEQGEIDKAVIPCIIREDLGNRGVLTAEEIETINIICANDYRDKTHFEKLDEVQGKDKPSEADADEEPGTPGAVDDPLDSQQEDVAETLEAGDRPETPVNTSRSLDMAELEEKLDSG